jgi:hypothetical protein
MKPRSSLAALYDTIQVPITPVPTQPDVERPPSIGGCGVVHGTSSVRDNAAVRANLAEPVTPKSAHDQANDFWYQEAQRMRAQEDEWKRKNDERYQTVRL